MAASAPHMPPTLGPEPIPWSKPGILVGVDGSEESIEALRVAADMAPKLGLPLHALAVWDYPVLLYADRYYPEIEDTSETQSETVARDAVHAVFGDSVPEWCTSGTARGSISGTLIRYSGHAAFVAVGSRGHGGFAGLLLGSVSAALTSHAQCSVLVVRTAPEADGTAS